MANLMLYKIFISVSLTVSIQNGHKHQICVKSSRFVFLTLSLRLSLDIFIKPYKFVVLSNRNSPNKSIFKVFSLFKIEKYRKESGYLPTFTN